MAKKDMPEGIKDADWRTIYNCETLEQALAVIHYSAAVMINTSHDARIIGDDEHYLPNRFTSAIAVSKADGLKYVQRLMEHARMTTRDGTKLALRLYITERKDTNRYDFVKHQPKPDRTVRTCWIG